MAVERYKIDIPAKEVERLYAKLRNARPPTNDVVPGAGNDYGIPTKWATEMYDYWLDKFSWKSAEDHINSFDHFTTEIEGLNIRFVHQKSENKNAVPLLMVHGWPGSFHEFSEIIPLLTNPSSGSQAFHVIAPSIPGFCFSSPPPRREWTMKDTTRVFNMLMLRLGYEEYAVQAGDWGQFVARELGANPEYAGKHVRFVHLNYCPGSFDPKLGDEDLTEREKACRAAGVDWQTTHVGYAVLMRTRPQTVGWMLEDNPAGLLAFVGEKYQEASNPRVHYSKRWKDHVLTTVCLYYFSRCIMSSSLVYFENVRHDQFAEYSMREENLIRVPFGYTSCWFDTAPNSKRAAEMTGVGEEGKGLVWYKERDDTGHFACLENPAGLAQDIRELCGQVLEA